MVGITIVLYSVYMWAVSNLAVRDATYAAFQMLVGTRKLGNVRLADWLNAARV